jgi:putative membrane protein
MDTRFLATLLLGASLGALAQTSQTTPTTPDTSATLPASPAAAPASPPSARSIPSSPKANGSGLAAKDVKFIEDVAKGGLAEIELGKLAQRQAQDPAVKDFGARMVKDHTAAGEKLRPIADAKGIVLPSGIDKSHQKDVDKLAKKSGADFDKAFMDHMVTDHRKVVKEFQKEAKSAKDADVQQFASSTLPTIEEHLRLAQQIHPIK